MIITNTKTNRYYNPNQPKFFVVEVETELEEDNDDEENFDQSTVVGVSVLTFDEQGNNCPSSYEQHMSEVLNNLTHTHTVKQMFDIIGRNYKKVEDNDLIETVEESDRLSHMFPMYQTDMFELPEYEFVG